MPLASFRNSNKDIYLLKNIILSLPLLSFLPALPAGRQAAGRLIAAKNL